MSARHTAQAHMLAEKRRAEEERLLVALAAPLPRPGVEWRGEPSPQVGRRLEAS